MPCTASRVRLCRCSGMDVRRGLVADMWSLARRRAFSKVGIAPPTFFLVYTGLLSTLSVKKEPELQFDMAVKGLKQTSPVFSIGAFLNESAPATYTQQEFTLPLNTLDREVFIVTDVMIELANPNLTAADTRMECAVTKTSLANVAGLPTINMSAVLAKKVATIEYDAATGNHVPFEFRAPGDIQTTGSENDYVGIISTPDFFVSIEGVNTTSAGYAAVRLQGYRAVADASLYAALVTEELSD